MSVPAIEPSGFVPYVAPKLPVGGAEETTPLGAPSGPSGPGGVAGTDFASMLAGGLEHLQGVQDRADTLAVQAATGDLANLHDYTIAATEAAVTTQLTVAVRNKALEAFNEIMRMPI
jgi:flagellar hook-basal body complex protein FliE